MSSKKKVKSLEDVWYSVNLKLNPTYPRGLICIDIDSQLVWDTIIDIYSKGSLKGCILNPTIQGGHIYFRSVEKLPESIKSTLNLGIIADFLTKYSSCLGPGKYVMGSPEGEHILNDLPPAFRKRLLPRSEPLVTEKLIREGLRNDTLFKWINAKSKLPYHERVELCIYLGEHMCDPPLD